MSLGSTPAPRPQGNGNGPVKEILIAGGGTSGWMSALYLQRALGDSVCITLVESPSIGTIGVGEATFNTIKNFFDYVGLAEEVWMPLCEATYKLAIKFNNWGSKPGHFYHPFQRYPLIDGVDLPEWWLKVGAGKVPFDYACFNAPALCDAFCSPKHLDGMVFEDSPVPVYAYHFDAGLLAQLLQGLATRRGVRHVQGNIEEVLLGADGTISAVRLAGGESLEADLYLDCTGNRGMLINQALGTQFDSFRNSLFCDRAVVVRLAREPEMRGIAPYTTATALSAGWAWSIPLFSRISHGYVYSSDFLSPEAAVQELAQHIRVPLQNSDVSHVGMRIGRTREPWVKNCVSIGLSSGFVEPLESTGLFFIQYGLAELVNHFPDRGFDEHIASSYNQAVGQCIDGVRDFLVLHYCANDRKDTLFWRSVKQEAVIPDTLRERLALWRRRLPNVSTVNQQYHGFASYSYTVMLLGLGHHPNCSLPLLAHLPDEHARETFDKIRERSRTLVSDLPSHYEYLQQMYSALPGK